MNNGQGCNEKSVDDVIQKIAKNDPNYDRAYLDDIRINEQQVEALANAIEKNTHLTYLNLNSPYLSAKHLKRIKEALEKNQTISEVILASNCSDANYQVIYDEIMARYAEKPSCRTVIQRSR